MGREMNDLVYENILGVEHKGTHIDIALMGLEDAEVHVCVEMDLLKKCREHRSPLRYIFKDWKYYELYLTADQVDEVIYTAVVERKS